MTYPIHSEALKNFLLSPIPTFWQKRGYDFLSSRQLVILQDCLEINYLARNVISQLNFQCNTFTMLTVFPAKYSFFLTRFYKSFAI